MSEAADSAESTTKRKVRSKGEGGAPRRRGASVPTSAPSLDDETAAALTLYNTYLAADRALQAHERALKKAEKAKDEAAAAVRKLNDRKAPAAETAEAEATYRGAVEALQRLRAGTTAPASGDEDTTTQEPEDTTSDNADDTTTQEPEDTTSDNADDTTTQEPEDTTSDNADEAPSVGVEASVGDEDLTGDEPAGVAS